MQFSKDSQGNVFQGENEDGTQIELESRNENFLNKEFHKSKRNLEA